MEFLFEIIFDFIVEFAMEFFNDKRVPFPIRILAIIILIAVFGGIIALFFGLAVMAIRQGKIAAGVLLSIVDLLVIASVVYGIKKKKK